MQQLKVLGVYALILAAVIYTAIKAYIYFGVKGNLDDAIARAQPFAQISYSGISSSLDGSIEVDGIEVKTDQQALPIRIGSLQLQGTGIGFLFDAAKGFGQGRIPSAMQASMRRLELPDIQEVVPSVLPPLKSGGRGPVPDQCSLGGMLRSAALMRSDSYPLLLDLNIGYQMDLLARIGRLDFGYDVQGGESFTVDVKLSGMLQPGAVMMGAAPVVDRLRIRYKPNGEYLKKRVSDCAKKQETSESIYVEGLLAQPDGRFVEELGFVPGNGLRQGIVRFLLKPVEILVVAGPIDEPLQLGSGQIPAGRLVDFLNLEVSLNGERVSDLSFAVAADVDATGTNSADAAISADQGNKVRSRARYIETPIDELGKYLGRPVRLLMSRHDNLQSGVLVAVQDSEVNVEKRMRQGRMSVHVPFEDIERIEVLRFPDTAE
jgi:hypothetical protein